MDIFRLSLTPPSPTPLSTPPLPTPPASTPPSSPFDWRKIPYAIDVPREDDTAFRGIPEKSPQKVAMDPNCNIDCLMAKFTRGFDPSTFGIELMTELPKLVKNVRPGSYEQLFVILLEESDNMDRIQHGLRGWLCERYPQLASSLPVGTETVDESYFLTELQMLRKLVEPLRGKRQKPIYWMNTRRIYPTSVCEQLEAAVKVIEEFKLDVVEALENDTEDRSCYSTLPVSNPRSSMMSMKEVRIIACEASLKWDEFPQAELEQTRFYHFYKNDVIKNRPEKARKEGWLPPSTTKAPRPTEELVKEGDLVNWPAHRGNQKLFDLLVKTALWLTVARGLAAVHLFCDVARLFTTHEPSRKANKSYVDFLHHLVQFKANDGFQFAVSVPFPRSASIVGNGNPDYFDDVRKTNRTLLARLAERPSLLEKKKKTLPFTHTHPVQQHVQVPSRTRAGPGTWPRTAAAYVNRGTSVYEESTEAPRRVFPRSRSTTGFQEKTPWVSPRPSLPEVNEDVSKQEL